MSKLLSEPVHSTIIRMAVPMLAGTFAMNMYQLTNAWFVSRLGTEALAAISFTFPVIMLFSFITRGLGTGAMTFAILYGVFIGAIFIIFAGPMAELFSKEKAVTDVLKSYIYITCAGYGLLEVHRYAGFCMTGTHEPFQASILNIIRVVVFLIPFSLLGSWLLNLNGLFIGRLVTDILSGLTGIWWSGMVLKKVGKRVFLKDIISKQAAPESIDQE